MPEIVGEYLDRLANIDMRRVSDPKRGRSRLMHDAVLRKQGKPATTLAASRLLATLSDGDFALPKVHPPRPRAT